MMQENQEENQKDAAISSVGDTSVTVVAPPGELGVVVGSYAGLSGTFVVKALPWSKLRRLVLPGYQIVAVDGQDVTDAGPTEVMSIVAQKTLFEKTLTFTKGPSPGSSSSKIDAPQSQQPRAGQCELDATDPSLSAETQTDPPAEPTMDMPH